MSKRKIAVLAGGRSSEYEVSISSGTEVMENLDKNKYDAKLIIVANEQGNIDFITELKQFKPDVVFIAMHGSYGEDGRLQGILDYMNIPYVGSGVLASALGMNKLKFKQLMSFFEVLMPKWSVIYTQEKLEQRCAELGYPCVVKQISGGSSLGVYIVKANEELKVILEKENIKEGLLVEEYIKGTEVSCGVLGNKDLEALPVIEIMPKKEFFDYEAKYETGKSEEIVPARIDEEVALKIQQISLEVYRILGCRDFARTDFIIRENNAYLLEINTIPGLTPNSLLPKEAASIGINYSKLLDRLIEGAILV